MSPAVIIEAKITSDDGTARDKVARIKELETQRNEHAAAGGPKDKGIACIDGRGFRQRREDMRAAVLTRRCCAPTRTPHTGSFVFRIFR